MSERNAKPSAGGFWMDNGMAYKVGQMPFVIVDCGYVKHKHARDNCDRLTKALGVKGKRGYVEIAGHGRVLVRVPTGRESVLKRFKRIEKEAGYCWTTHRYDYFGPQFELSQAL